MLLSFWHLVSGSVGKVLVNITHQSEWACLWSFLLQGPKQWRVFFLTAIRGPLDKTVLASGQHNSPKSVCWSSLPRNKFSDDEVIIIPLESVHEVESCIESAIGANSLRRVLKIILFTTFKVETSAPLWGALVGPSSGCVYISFQAHRWAFHWFHLCVAFL